MTRNLALEWGDYRIRVNGVDAAALAAQVQASEAKRATDNHMFLITLSQLKDAIERMEAQADEMEKALKKSTGIVGAKISLLRFWMKTKSRNAWMVKAWRIIVNA